MSRNGIRRTIVASVLTVLLAVLATPHAVAAGLAPPMVDDNFLSKIIGSLFGPLDRNVRQALNDWGWSVVIFLIVAGGIMAIFGHGETWFRKAMYLIGVLLVISTLSTLAV
jgi:type IV secretory pathway VirB2 component (pilin)